jgi:hypothetical protein
MNGTETLCVLGQLPFVEYAMWLLWSALSRRRPSQQSGKLTFMCRRSFSLQPGTVV